MTHTLALRTGIPPKCPQHGTWMHWNPKLNKIPDGSPRYGRPVTVREDGRSFMTYGNLWECDA